MRRRRRGRLRGRWLENGPPSRRAAV